MSFHTNSKVTEGIRVEVRTLYLREESSPRHHYYVFAYQIEITNESAHTVQLMSREWNIVDGLGDHRTVVGDGVIGKQPVIAPGETHSYTSGSHFQTSIGKMSGFYYMKRMMDNSDLKVEIPPFVMAVPFINN